MHHSTVLENLLAGVEKPGRYIGNESNAYRKPFEEAHTRFALAFPDTYEVGLSHLGLRLLYHQLNCMDQVMADRVYTPWLDFEQKLRQNGEALRALESGRSLDHFDFVGVSLQYELSYTNILTILHLGRIPFQARNRTGGHPFVIAGGPCAFNPEPLADFLDLVVLGEAEGVLPELIHVHRSWKDSGGSRKEFLEAARSIPGVYIPSFFEVSYKEDHTVSAVTPLYDDYPAVHKRLVKDLDRTSPLPEAPLVPLLNIVHDRLGIEIARGCTRGCRFCQAGFIYRPVRERHPQAVLDCTQKAVASSGFEDLSLLSLSTGDYTKVQPLLEALMEGLQGRNVAVSFPSMRVGTLTPELMELIQRVRKTGFTLAPEAGSERLRMVVNKEIRNEDLLDAAENAFRLGWRLLKLYFMIGLPTESPEDLDALVARSTEVWQVAKRWKASVNVSVSTFVPKPHTPFQWSAQIPRERIWQHLDELRGRLKRPGMRFKWSHPEQSFLEGVFARGDRRLGAVLVRAWELGARFDGWGENFETVSRDAEGGLTREEIWERAFQEASDRGGRQAPPPWFYANRERSEHEVFPWDHLSTGVDKTFLLREYRRAIQGAYTGDCRTGPCLQCGVCDHDTVKPVLQGESVITDVEGDKGFPVRAVPSSKGSTARPSAFLYHFQYAKTGGLRFFGQLEVSRAFERAVRRSNLPAAFSQGYHPHVKLSFTEALPLGFESLAEEAYITLDAQLPAREVLERLNQSLPEGLQVLGVTPVARRHPTQDRRRVTYRASGLPSWLVSFTLNNWLAHGETLLTKKTKKGSTQRKLGEVLLDVRRVSASAVEMDLCDSQGSRFRPTNILEHFLALSGRRTARATEQSDSQGRNDLPAASDAVHFALSECRICKIAAEPLEENDDVRRAHHQR